VLPLSSGEADETNVYPIDVTLTFSEVVTGLTLADVSVTGSPTLGDLVSDADGDVYTLNVYPTVQVTATPLRTRVLGALLAVYESGARHARPGLESRRLESRPKEAAR
jgi:hypothetical protein